MEGRMVVHDLIEVSFDRFSEKGQLFWTKVSTF